MLNKKICREFAAPGIAMSMNSGLLHAEQVKYIVQTAVKIISHKRTLATIKNVRYELDAMDGGKMTPGKASAIASSARLLSGATDRLVELLFKGQALDEPGRDE